MADLLKFYGKAVDNGVIDSTQVSYDDFRTSMGTKEGRDSFYKFASGAGMKIGTPQKFDSYIQEGLSNGQEEQPTESLQEQPTDGGIRTQTKNLVSSVGGHNPYPTMPNVPKQIKAPEIVRPKDYQEKEDSGILGFKRSSLQNAPDNEDSWLSSPFYNLSDDEISRQISELKSIQDAPMQKYYDAFKEQTGRDYERDERRRTQEDEWKFNNIVTGARTKELKKRGYYQAGAARRAAIEKEVDALFSDNSDRAKQVDERLTHLENERAWRQNQKIMPEIANALKEQEKKVQAAKSGVDKTGAEHILQQAINLYNAPSKYGTEKGVSNWGKGLFDQLTDYDTWTAGMSEMARMINLNNIVKKIESGGPESLTEEERTAFDSFMLLSAVQDARGNDLSRGYTIGQQSAQSIPFMVEMWLTAGAGAATKKALVEAAEKNIGKEFAEKLARSLGGTFVRDSAGNLVERGATQTVAGKIGKTIAYDVAQTAAMPTTYANIYRDVLNEKLFGDGDFNWKDLARSATSQVLETGTERWGGQLIDKGISRGLSHFLPIGANNIWGKNKYFGMFMDHYIASPLGETGEEYINALASGIRSINPLYADVDEKSISNNEVLRNEARTMFTPQGFADTFLTMLPMSVFGGAANAAANRAYTNGVVRDYTSAREDVEKLLQKSGATKEQAENIMLQLESSADDKSFADKIDIMYNNLKSLGVDEKVIDSTLGNYAKNAANYNKEIGSIMERFLELSEGKKEEIGANLDKYIHDTIKKNVDKKANPQQGEQSTEATGSDVLQPINTTVPRRDMSGKEVTVNIDGKKEKVLFFSPEFYLNSDGSINKDASKGVNIQIKNHGFIPSNEVDKYMDAINETLRTERANEEAAIIEKQEQEKLEKETAAAQQELVEKQEQAENQIFDSAPRLANGNINVDKANAAQNIIWNKRKHGAEVAMQRVLDKIRFNEIERVKAKKAFDEGKLDPDKYYAKIDEINDYITSSKEAATTYLDANAADAIDAIIQENAQILQENLANSENSSNFAQNQGNNDNRGVQQPSQGGSPATQSQPVGEGLAEDRGGLSGIGTSPVEGREDNSGRPEGRSLSVTAIDSLDSLNEEIDSKLRAKGIDTPLVRVVRVNGQEFHDAIAAGKAQNENGWSVDVKEPSEYDKCFCILTEDGHAGIAVTEDGDIVSLFSAGKHHGISLKLLLSAIGSGGVKADFFMTPNKKNGLQNIYWRLGARITGQNPFSEDYAEEEVSGWKEYRDEQIAQYGQEKGHKIAVDHPTAAAIFPTTIDKAIENYVERNGKMVEKELGTVELAEEQTGLKDVPVYESYDEMIDKRNEELMQPEIPEGETVDLTQDDIKMVFQSPNRWKFIKRNEDGSIVDYGPEGGSVKDKDGDISWKEKDKSQKVVYLEDKEGAEPYYLLSKEDASAATRSTKGAHQGYYKVVRAGKFNGEEMYVRNYFYPSKNGLVPRHKENTGNRYEPLNPKQVLAYPVFQKEGVTITMEDVMYGKFEDIKRRAWDALGLINNQEKANTTNEICSKIREAIRGWETYVKERGLDDIKEVMPRDLERMLARIRFEVFKNAGETLQAKKSLTVDTKDVNDTHLNYAAKEKFGANPLFQLAICMHIAQEMGYGDGTPIKFVGNSGTWLTQAYVVTPEEIGRARKRYEDLNNGASHNYDRFENATDEKKWLEKMYPEVLDDKPAERRLSFGNEENESDKERDTFVQNRKMDRKPTIKAEADEAGYDEKAVVEKTYDKLLAEMKSLVEKGEIEKAGEKRQEIEAIIGKDEDLRKEFYTAIGLYNSEEKTVDETPAEPAKQKRKATQQDIDNYNSIKKEIQDAEEEEDFEELKTLNEELSALMEEVEFSIGEEPVRTTKSRAVGLTLARVLNRIPGVNVRILNSQEDVQKVLSDIFDANIEYSTTAKDYSTLYKELADVISKGWLIHGTNADFKEFDKDKIAGGNRAKEGYGFYFAERPYKPLEYGTNFKLIRKSDFNYLDSRTEILKDSKLRYIFFESLNDLQTRLFRLEENMYEARNNSEYDKAKEEAEKLQEEINSVEEIISVAKSVINRVGQDCTVGQLEYNLPSNLIPRLAELYVEYGYDGYETDGVYTIFNFEKLNNNFTTLENIESKEHKQPERADFLKDSDGTIYGFAIGSDIYLTPDGVNANTPIHEYTHLWVKAIRKSNPALWNKIVTDLKNNKALWESVTSDEAYADLTDDNDIASEVLARYSGRKGEKLLLALARGKYGTTKLATTFVNRVKKTINSFWNAVAKLFMDKETRAVDDIADMVLTDLFDSTSIEDDRIEAEMEEIKKTAQENGTFMKAPNGQPTNLTERQWLLVRTQNFKNWFGDWENDPANASKIVDENGEPRVVYHGSNKAGFDMFESDPKSQTVGFYATDNRKVAAGYTREEDNEPLPREERDAVIGAEAHPGIYSMFMNIRNPFILDFSDEEGNAGHWTDYPTGVWVVPANEEWGITEQTFDNEEDAKAYFESFGKEFERTDYYERTLTTDQLVSNAAALGYDGCIFPNIYDGNYSLGEPMTDYVAIVPNQIKSSANVGYMSAIDNRIEFMKLGKDQYTLTPSEKKRIKRLSDKRNIALADGHIPNEEKVTMLGNILAKGKEALKGVAAIGYEWYIDGSAFAEPVRALEHSVNVFRREKGLSDIPDEQRAFSKLVAQSSATASEIDKVDELIKDYKKVLEKYMEDVIAGSDMYKKYQTEKWVRPGFQKALTLSPLEFFERYLIARENLNRIKTDNTRGLAAFKILMGVPVDEFVEEFRQSFYKSEADIERLDEVLAKIKEVTDYALTQYRDCGRITEEDYQMYKAKPFYVPLQGFSETEKKQDENEMEDTETLPALSRSRGKVASLIHAEGGESMPGSVLSYIAFNASYSAEFAKQNESKRAAYYMLRDNADFCIAHGIPVPEELVYTTIVENGEEKVVRTRFGETPEEAALNKKEYKNTLNLIRNANIELGNAQSYEQELSEQLAKAKSESDKQRIEKEIEHVKANISLIESNLNALNGSLKFLSPEDAMFVYRNREGKQPENVSVYVDGMHYTLMFPDRVSVANALNDRKNPDWKLGELKAFTSWIAQQQTVNNRKFWTNNLTRDALRVFNLGFIKYGRKFIEFWGENYKDALAEASKYLANGKKASDSQTGILFSQFIKDGANGGFSKALRPEHYRAQLKDVNPQSWKYKNLKENIRSGLNGLDSAIAFMEVRRLANALNEWTELAGRFAVYKTVLDLGYSRAQAIEDAHELPTDLTMHGRGNKFFNLFNAITPFVNAAIQGVVGVGRVLFIDPSLPKFARASLTAGMLALIGYLLARLNPDDPEEKYKPSQYERENYFLIGKNWRFAMSEQAKPWINIGTQIALCESGHRTQDEMWMSIMSVAAMNSLPIPPNMTEAFIKFSTDQDYSWAEMIGDALTPSILEQFGQVARNENFMGGKIRSDKGDTPEYLRAPNESPALQDLAYLIYRKQGGMKDIVSTHTADGEKMGKRVNINPREIRTCAFFIPPSVIQDACFIYGLGKDIVKDNPLGTSISPRDYPLAPFSKIYLPYTDAAYIASTIRDANAFVKDRDEFIKGLENNLNLVSLELKKLEANGQKDSKEYKSLEKTKEDINNKIIENQSDLVYQAMKNKLDSYGQVDMSKLRWTLPIQKEKFKELLPVSEDEKLTENKDKLINEIYYLLTLEKMQKYYDDNAKAEERFNEKFGNQFPYGPKQLYKKLGTGEEVEE